MLEKERMDIISLDIKKVAVQFIKFGIVGLSNTFVSLLVYYIFVYLGLNYLIANTIAFIISVLNAYYWQNRYVFDKGGQSHLVALFKVYLSYGFSFLVSTGLLFVMVNMLDISKYIGPLIVLIVTVPLNFVINKFWAYKEKRY